MTKPNHMPGASIRATSAGASFTTLNHSENVVTPATREHERSGPVGYPAGAWRYVVADQIAVALHQESRGMLTNAMVF